MASDALLPWDVHECCCRLVRLLAGAMAEAWNDEKDTDGTFIVTARGRERHQDRIDTLVDAVVAVLDGGSRFHVEKAVRRAMGEVAPRPGDPEAFYDEVVERVMAGVVGGAVGRTVLTA